MRLRVPKSEHFTPILNTAAGSTTGEVTANAWASRLELVVDGRLDADSTTAWYLAGDPAQVDTVKRIYFNGQRGVDVERSEDFETAGLKLRATLDFDARAFDYSPGT